ncbi:MAG: HAD-IG family 5'-nucleotidase [Deltaproteobacteria bacterium]|nr:HAD-IG family 5'-nucleotidase [Deltaproteobacteria bacterium]
MTSRQDDTLRPPPGRGIYANRTLNLRAVRAIGYDMDYTLVHYNVAAWELRAYEYLQDKLVARGWPVGDLRFDPEMTVRGLVLDLEKGNILKTNRFGYVKQAAHGSMPLPFEEQRATYAQTMIDLGDARFAFINTLFSKSEVCMYAQLVDRLDAGKIPGVLGYRDLYRQVKRGLDAAHMEGALKAEILADPKRFVELDEEIPLALLDQQRSGKKLLLITNSEWSYTREIMRYAFDPFLPGEMSWRELFDVIIVSAGKPAFFTGRNPIFEVVDRDEGLLKPVVGGLEDGGIYLGGSASLVEERLGIPAEQILYVGDHLFSDVHVSKNTLRWRTALVVRELEEEIAAISAFAPRRKKLARLMEEKEALEHQHCRLRLALQHKQRRYGDPVKTSVEKLRGRLATLKSQLQELDETIAPLAREASEIANARWGLIMRAGNDKSLFARGVEKSADIYLSRVSNFLYLTPFAYLRAPAGSLPHDPGDNAI